MSYVLDHICAIIFLLAQNIVSCEKKRPMISTKDYLYAKFATF